MQSIDQPGQTLPASNPDSPSSDNDIQRTVPSMPLYLNIQAIAAEDPRLPTPTIREAVGTTLDLATFQGDAHATLAPWPLMAAEQRVWLDADTRSSRIPIVQNYIVKAQDVGKTLSYPISRTALDALNDGDTLTVRAKVSLNGSAQDGAGIAYPTQTFTLRKALPGWEDFESAEMGGGGRYDSNAVTIIPGGGDCYVDNAPAGMSGKALRVVFPPIAGRADLVVIAKIPATSVSFRYSTRIALTCFYIANNSVARATLPAGMRTFKTTGMREGNITISAENSPGTYWIDDILFE